MGEKVGIYTPFPPFLPGGGGGGGREGLTAVPFCLSVRCMNRGSGIGERNFDWGGGAGCWFFALVGFWPRGGCNVKRRTCLFLFLFLFRFGGGGWYV